MSFFGISSQHRVQLMHALQGALLAMLLCSDVSGQTLRIEPAVISAGNTARLVWTSEPNGFLIGYGKVNGNGHADIKPSSTTDFILVTETPDGFSYSQMKLIVTGAKGDDELPSLNLFDLAVQGNHSGMSYIDFQSQVWNVLQNQFGHYVRGDYVPERKFVTFYTDFTVRGDLVSIDEKSIRARRIAFAVDIIEPLQKNGIISFSVRTLLQFQRRGESTWRFDKNSPLAKAEALKFKTFLESIK
jgi:hypothetical protein